MDEFEKKQQDYQKHLDSVWSKAIQNAFGKEPPRSKGWSDPFDVANVLRHFMEGNYAYLPPDGHLPLFGVDIHEDGKRLLFDLSESGLLEMIADRATFEYIEKAPIESFFLLELKSMRPSGLYHEVRANEQVVRVDGVDYDYSIVEHGVFEHDEDGNEVPLPEDAKTVLRLLGGSLLIVSKGSMWNHSDETWAGIHARKNPAEIRSDIEHALERA